MSSRSYIDFCSRICCCSNSLKTTVVKLRVIGLIIPYIHGFFWACVIFSKNNKILEIYKLIILSFSQIIGGGFYLFQFCQTNNEDNRNIIFIDSNYYINYYPLFIIESFLFGILMGNVNIYIWVNTNNVFYINLIVMAI